jgi:hypothetical protein
METFFTDLIFLQHAFRFQRFSKTQPKSFDKYIAL